MLIQELIERMPAQYRLDCALYAKRMPKPNIITFSRSGKQRIYNSSSTSNEEKRKPQRVNVDEERPSEGKKKQTSTYNSVYMCVM